MAECFQYEQLTAMSVSDVELLYGAMNNGLRQVSIAIHRTASSLVVGTILGTALVRVGVGQDKAGWSLYTDSPRAIFGDYFKRAVCRTTLTATLHLSIVRDTMR